MSSNRALNLYQAGDWHDTEIRVHRAGAIGNLHVPTLALLAHDEMPDIPHDQPLERAREIYTCEGRQIADALIGHLPGGTLDQVLIRLLEHKASYLQVGADAPFVGPMKKIAADENGRCPDCDSQLTNRTTLDGKPSYCDICDREVSEVIPS